MELSSLSPPTLTQRVLPVYVYNLGLYIRQDTGANPLGIIGGWGVVDPG